MTSGAAADGDDTGELQRALAADLDSGFVTLFTTYRQVVFATALRVCGQWSDAEDLAAEAFLRAYRALRGYEHDRVLALRLRPWLLAILLNTWRNRQRSAARHPSPIPVERLPEPTDPGPSVELLVERDETDRELVRLLRRLPERERVAVVLRHIGDLPVSEIAAVLDRPEGTVKSHIARGLARLRRLRGTESARPPHSTTHESDDR